MSYQSLLVGAGFSLSYRSRGLPNADGSLSQEKLATGATVGLAYMVYNRLPIAIGPELDYGFSLAPAAPFTTNRVFSGLAFWYAPFPAPVLLGGAWLVGVTHTNGSGTDIDLFSPALRVAFGFP